MDNFRNTKESNIDKKYRESLFLYSHGDIKESKNTRVPKFEFLCPFCSAHRKVARRTQSALLCSGWRIEGATGLVVLMLGLMNVSMTLSFLGSWSDLTLDCLGSINWSDFTLAQQVGGGIVGVLVSFEVVGGPGRWLDFLWAKKTPARRQGVK